MANKKYHNTEKSQQRKRRVRQLGLLALSFIVIYGIYAAGCRMLWKPIVPVYFGALLTLLVAFVVLNRGFDSKLPEYDMLPDNWDGEKKADFLTSEKKRKKFARILLYIIIPLLLTFAFDIIYLGFFAGLSN